MNEQIAKSIDDWNVCPYEDNIYEFFKSFTHCTEMYLKIPSTKLDTKVIVSIISDLREYLNPHSNRNLHHFTDIICDSILLEYKNRDIECMDELKKYIAECEERVFLKL